MNMFVNSVQLIGNLGADTEIRTTNQGIKVANARLATNAYSKDSQDEWLKTTSWHNLVFWDKVAEQFEKYNKKGTCLVIQGSLTYREYVDVHDIKRDVTHIRVHQFFALAPSTVIDHSVRVVPNETDELPL